MKVLIEYEKRTVEIEDSSFVTITSDLAEAVKNALVAVGADPERVARMILGEE